MGGGEGAGSGGWKMNEQCRLVGGKYPCPSSHGGFLWIMQSIRNIQCAGVFDAFMV